MVFKKKVIRKNSKKKDSWDKAGVIIGSLIPITIAFVGYFGSIFLEKRQENETRIRLYTELISKREEAESALRKDMFNSIIGTFLDTKTFGLEDKVLQLELLSYNFHESFNLMPLFSHLNNQIALENVLEPAKKNFKDRLQKLAREIIAKQVAVLEGAGDKNDLEIDFTSKTNLLFQVGIDLNKTEFEINEEQIDLEVKAEDEIINRTYRLTVLNVDTMREEIRVRLEVRTPINVSDEDESEDTSSSDGDFPVGESASLIEAEFWVGPFDFPMIDNTRLSYDQRCAVVLKKFKYPRATLTVICFPGSHSSLKEKPYYGEILHKLLPDRKTTKN